ncbi:MAG: hypothetical protein QM773_00875 [Hyphomonadaceae bacterium]
MLSQFAKSIRQDIDAAAKLGDATRAHVFTEFSREADKQLGLVLDAGRYRGADGCARLSRGRLGLTISVPFDTVFRLEEGMDLTRRIADAPMEMEPFPHLVLDGVFEAEDYQRLRANLPSADAFGTGTYGHIKAAGEADPLFSPMPDHLAATWAEVDEVWRRDIAPALTSRFEPFLPYKLKLTFGEDMLCGAANIPTALMLHRRLAGDVQRPHMDNATSLFTCVFYLGPEDADARDGLVMYRVGKKEEFLEAYRARRDVRAWYPDPAAFAITDARRMSYGANRFVAFLSMPLSVHSVETLHNPVRYSMQAQALLADAPTLYKNWIDSNQGGRPAFGY